VLDYDGLAVGVSVWRASDEEWVRDVMSPAFGITETGAAAVEVELVVDPARHEALHRLGPAGGHVDGAILDDSTESFERWSGSTEDAERRTAFDPLFGVFHEVGPGPTLRITAEGGEVCRVALMRVVREFAMQASMRRGNLFLHAAAISVDGRALVIAGEKGAGKTTTLSWCLELLEEARFIANDRVRVACAEAPGFDVRAMPTVMSFRPPGLALLPQLEQKVRAQRGAPFHSRSEARDREELGPVTPFSDGRVGLSPTRYPELLGRASTASAPAAAIVFPEVADDSDGLRPLRLDEETSIGRLTRALFGAAALERQSDLFSYPRAGPFPKADELRARAARIASAVPCFAWRVGRGVIGDTAGLRAFLKTL